MSSGDPPNTRVPVGVESEPEQVDLDDGDVSASAEPNPEPPRRTVPPPLPAYASVPPQPEGSLPPRASYAPSHPPGSLAPPPPKRSPMYYGVLVLAIVVVGVVGAGGVALFLRRTKPVGAPAPTATQPTVITIPTVDMNDQADGG